MKKNLIIMLIVLFTFSVTFIACDNDPDETDPTLNGIWTDKDGNTVHFNNGTLTINNNGESSETGIFKTDGNKITLITQITECDYFNSGHMFSKEEVLDILKKTTPGGEISAADQLAVNTKFKSETVTATYFIDGNKLYLIYEDEEGDVTYIQTFTFTK